MKKTGTERLGLIFSMIIFGTIGIARRYLPLPSGFIAMIRGATGTLFLLCVIAIGRKKLSFGAIRRNLLWLCLSGGLIGLNWILLFEAYNYTSVATATLCYYMAPIFVILAAPFVLRERLTARKALCVVAALLGMVLVSGVLKPAAIDLRGILLGLGAALLYASVILINQRIQGVSAYEKTVIQLACAALTILPYTLLLEKIAPGVMTPSVILLLLLVGVLHTWKRNILLSVITGTVAYMLLVQFVF